MGVLVKDDPCGVAAARPPKAVLEQVAHQSKTSRQDIRAKSAVDLRGLDKPRQAVSPSLMNRRALLIAGTLLLSGCMTTRVSPPQGAGFELLEPVYTVSTDRDVLAIRVASNGCTKKEDFAFFVEKTPAGARVAFGRKRVDTCQTVAQGRVELTFTWEELGLKGRSGVFLANPVVAWTGPGSL